ncbi:MAG: helix-turn-helix domain-containing protein, partial [Desulfobacterales bacterium]
RVLILNEGEDVLDSMMVKNNSASVAKASFRNEPVPDLINLLGLNGEEPKLKSLSLKEIGKRTSDFIEKQVISYVLDQTGWNRSRANKILGISYKTLLAKIQDLELTPNHQFEEDAALTSSTPGPMI